MKKKSKISDQSSKIPSPFQDIPHKTERSGVGILMHWMREIIDDNNIDLGLPDIETSAKDRKMPDLVIYESRRSQRVLCLIEAKQPYFDVFDEHELKEPARKKATYRKAKYFALTNFKKLTWFNTLKVNELKPEEEQIIEKYDLSIIENLDEMENTRHRESIKDGLESFLSRLYRVHIGKEPEPKHPIDELLIFRIHEKIRVLSNYYLKIIGDSCHKDFKFAKKLQKWFYDQGWTFAWQSQDFHKAARQTAYLLVNKILFYNLLQAKRPNDLDPLEIPESLTKGALLQSYLQGYFSMVLRIDYENIYTTDFIDEVAFPDAKEVVKEIKDLIHILGKYDFSKLGFDVIGRIFERIIPKEERHNLGQYFTNADVVDLILRFSLHYEDDKVLDPSSGAGTFLVRAYQHKKLMNQRKKHEELLHTLWGNDIAKFPAHLATINLAINDLAVDENYPNILHEDFFTFRVGDEGFDPDIWRKTRAKTLGIQERELTYPRWFDAIVGNPPYTRQEEIGEISPEDIEYKEKIIENTLSFHGKKIAKISKRAGIYAYFFVHGTKFLKEDGYFGFIVSNSWLDVDYGKGLQEFFLDNYKIVSIIESKVERWFEDADINTCIVILQKCKNKKERNENIVRFVYLKKPLRYFIPPAQDIWEKQVERLNEIDNLKKTILAHNELYENDELRIYPKKQSELWDEGFEKEEKKYSGSKWGKYLRAPETFFKILKNNKNKLVALKDIAEVRRGYTTGANEFFYLTEKEIKKKGIEKEFWMHKDGKGNWLPNKLILSPREGKNVVIAPDTLKKILIVINKEKSQLKRKKVISYIKQGESKGFNERQTCRTRKLWYSINFRKPWPILFPMIHHDRQTVLLNRSKVQVDHNLFEIRPKKGQAILPLLCFLLSTVSMLIKEFTGRTNLGEGALKTEGIDVERLLVPKQYSKKTRQLFLNLIKKHQDASINSIFDDLNARNADEISLEDIRIERRELDKIVMGEILGLSDEEQLEVYRAVVELVKSRIEKAKSFGKKKKTVEEVDINPIKNTIVNHIIDTKEDKK
jgi:type I restriction-modification system DNA methylase subunit